MRQDGDMDWEREGAEDAVVQLAVAVKSRGRIMP
jgi:hypothetical protein